MPIDLPRRAVTTYPRMLRRLVTHQVRPRFRRFRPALRARLPPHAVEEFIDSTSQALPRSSTRPFRFEGQ